VGLEKDVAVVLLAEVGPDVAFACVYELPELRCEAPVFDDLVQLSQCLPWAPQGRGGWLGGAMRGHETRWGVAW